MLFFGILLAVHDSILLLLVFLFLNSRDAKHVIVESVGLWLIWRRLSKSNGTGWKPVCEREWAAVKVSWGLTERSRVDGFNIDGD